MDALLAAYLFIAKQNFNAMRATYNVSVFTDIEQRKRSSAPVSISFASLACETRFHFIYLLGPFRILKMNTRVKKSGYFPKWNLQFHIKSNER